MCHPLLIVGLPTVSLGGVLAILLLGDRVELKRPGWGLWTSLIGLASLAVLLSSWVKQVAACF